MVRQLVKRSKELEDGRVIERERHEPHVLHCDIIGEEFWRERPEILAD